MGKVLKGTCSASILKTITLVLALCFAGIAAKADSVTLIPLTAGPAGGTGSYASNCASGNTGSFSVNASGGINFLSNTGCYFGASSNSPFGTTAGFFSAYDGGGSVANLIALANGTYYETGIACNTTSVPASCNPGSGIPPATTTFGVYINNGTIIISDQNTVISGGVPPIGGNSVTVEFMDGGTTSTPEPTSVLMLGLGLLTLAGTGIFRKRMGFSV